MVSGVSIADACVSTYQQLKLEKKFKYILFTLNDTLTEIIVDKTSDVRSYDAFVEDLPRDQCRWAVYDFEFEKDGKRNKPCLVLWAPDNAKVKDKMVFASFKKPLKQRLTGITVEVQGTDPSELSYDTVLAKVLTSAH